MAVSRLFSSLLEPQRIYLEPTWPKNDCSNSYCSAWLWTAFLFHPVCLWKYPVSLEYMGSFRHPQWFYLIFNETSIFSFIHLLGKWSLCHSFQHFIILEKWVLKWGSVSLVFSTYAPGHCFLWDWLSASAGLHVGLCQGQSCSGKLWKWALYGSLLVAVPLQGWRFSLFCVYAQHFSSSPVTPWSS